MKRKIHLLLVVVAFSLVSVDSSGSEIAVTGRATAQIEPQYVTINIAISSLADKATEATQKTAELHRRVVGALQMIEDVEIHTDKYRVAPRWQRNSEHREEDKFLGYQANHDVVVILRNTDAAGEVVDAVIQAGAKNVGSIQFHAEVTDSLQEAALEAAVLQAKGKAEAIARAAGGRLGELIEISTQDAARAMRREIPTGVVYSSVSAGTRIMPSSTRVNVVVLARWEFIEGGE